MPIVVGKKAPAFALPNQRDEVVKLKDLAGKWVVVYFYPRDDTPGCTTEGIEFTKALPEFARLGAEVIGVSGDSPASHAKFCAKHSLGVTLLADSQHAMMEAYAAYGPKVSFGKESVGIIRSTVLIDPQGKVAHHWASVRAAGHAQEVLETLRTLAANAKG